MSQPHSVLGAALTSIVPWNDANVRTYVLQQRQHDLARNGFLQAQKRPGRPESDILLLAPALDATQGHPAIWEKLLSHYSNEATKQQLARIYADVPDQPLLINTLMHVGFRVYARQTIWRLPAHGIERVAHSSTAAIRPYQKRDDWALQRLYARVTPAPVQQAEGLGAEQELGAPILDWWHSFPYSQYVLEEAGEVQGCIRIGYGSQGIWLQLWQNFLATHSDQLHQLLAFALTEIRRQGIVRLPIYVGVREYQGGIGNVLAEYGFAPFSDRAKMAKQLVQWVKRIAPAFTPVLEGRPEIAAVPFTLPEQLPEKPE